MTPIIPPLLAPVLLALRDCDAYAMGGDFVLHERMLKEASSTTDARVQLRFMWRSNAVLSAATMSAMARAWLALVAMDEEEERLMHVALYQKERADAGHCLANTDGECDWSGCPQKVEYRSTCPRWATRRKEREDE